MDQYIEILKLILQTGSVGAVIVGALIALRMVLGSQERQVKITADGISTLAKVIDGGTQAITANTNKLVEIEAFRRGEAEAKRNKGAP